MLTVGEDTYVSVADATEYLQKHYPSTDARRAAWEATEEADQEIFLRNACEKLNMLPYRGITYIASQALAFPRFFGENYVMAYRELIAPEAMEYPELQDVPKEVIAAQIEEAFELACPSESTDRHGALNGAIKSYSIGHLSETFKESASEAEKILMSERAAILLAPFMEGAYDIC